MPFSSWLLIGHLAGVSLPPGPLWERRPRRDEAEGAPTDVDASARTLQRTLDGGPVTLASHNAASAMPTQ